MPFDQQFDSYGAGDFHHIWNVTDAVGEHCPNRREDVMLVQYMLLKLYAGRFRQGRSRPPGNLQLNGICEPVTLDWIRAFQRDLNEDEPGIVSIDSRIDRACGMLTTRPGPVVGPNGPGGFTVYTIVMLNKFFSDEWWDYHNDPLKADLPLLLKVLLKSKRQPRAACFEETRSLNAYCGSGIRP